MKVDLPPLKPRALAVRTIPDASDDLARAFGLPAGRRALGIITATSDDALYAALDQGTKASPADVVYAKSRALLGSASLMIVIDPGKMTASADSDLSWFPTLPAGGSNSRRRV